jgi:hypothetical protein
MPMAEIIPTPGQVWADNDKRCIGRMVQIDAIRGDFAFCTVVADRGDPKRLKGRHNCIRPAGWTPIGRSTVIKLDRLKPTSSGYRLIDTMVSERTDV